MSHHESTADAFRRYQTSKASELRYLQAQANLETTVDLDRPLEVLDAASGNGLNSEWLLRRGHRVTLLDADPEMLDSARRRMTEAGIADGASWFKGRLEEADQVLEGRRFDLILCHHVLEYLSEPITAFRALRRLIADDGIFDLITLNPVSQVIRGVVQAADPVLADQRLDDLRYDAMWFGEAMLYSAETLLETASNSGWRRDRVQAIRVLSDYLAEDIKAERFDELMALEARLVDRDPYRWIGRYLQQRFAPV